MHNHPNSTGFNLPSAYQSHDNKFSYLIVLAVFFASSSAAAIIGAQIVGLV